MGTFLKRLNKKLSIRWSFSSSSMRCFSTDIIGQSFHAHEYYWVCLYSSKRGTNFHKLNSAIHFCWNHYCKILSNVINMAHPSYNIHILLINKLKKFTNKNWLNTKFYLELYVKSVTLNELFKKSSGIKLKHFIH